MVKRNMPNTINEFLQLFYIVRGNLSPEPPQMR